MDIGKKPANTQITPLSRKHMRKFLDYLLRRARRVRLSEFTATEFTVLTVIATEYVATVAEAWKKIEAAYSTK